jgi:hypothetical protein
MDYDPFWFILPEIALFALILGMVWFTLTEFGRAMEQATRSARRHVAPSADAVQPKVA